MNRARTELLLFAVRIASRIPWTLVGLLGQRSRTRASALLVRGAEAARRRNAFPTGLSLYRSAIAIHPKPDSKIYRRAASVAIRGGDARSALFLLELSLDLAATPGQALRVAKLARMLPGDGMLKHDTRRGIIEFNLGNVDLAQVAYAKAAQFDSSNLTAISGLLATYSARGQFDALVACLEQAVRTNPDNSKLSYRLARQQIDLASLAGGFDPTASYHTARINLAKALNLSPLNTPARHHLVRTYIRERRWVEASKVAWFPLPNRTSTLDSNIMYLDSILQGPLANDDIYEADGRVQEALDSISQSEEHYPPDWLFSLHWRLVSLGLVGPAYVAKDLCALSRLSALRQEDNWTVARVAEGVQILAYLNRFVEARGLIAERGGSSSEARLSLEGYISDIEFSQGNLERHRSREWTWPSFPWMHEMEDRFASLVSGKSIAVVGPAPMSADESDEAAQADVIIRTKSLPNSIAHQSVDISYYATLSASLYYDGIQDLLRSNHLGMAVFRSMAVVHRERFGDLAQAVRYCPDEYRLHYRSAPFAIQRILYDVLRYRPSGIRLYGINFFAGESLYSEMYNHGASALLKERRLTRATDYFPHDFLTDIRFTRRLTDRGIVDASTSVARVLSLPDDQYLAKVGI